jgi:DNA-binding LytR/AlgR family response regulator
MINVVIIEDEQLAAQKLSRILREVEPDIKILDIIPSVEKAVNFFSKNKSIELIFMDIQLEDGICFEIFEKIDLEYPVIFTTAFDEYMLKAFKQNSIDYLLKPIKKDDLKNAINKYKNIHQKINNAVLQKVINDFKTNDYKERFLIKVGEYYKSLEVKSVNCFFIKESCVFIGTKEGRGYGVDYSLDKIESLVTPRDFFRVNRNYMVRFEAIDNIVMFSSSRLKIKIKSFEEAEDIIVSRDRVKSFKEWMDR